MTPEFGSTLYSVLGLTIVIALLFMLILFTIAKLFSNKELEQASKEEFVEIGVSILLIGIISYLITNPIQSFSCGLLINNILANNTVNCNDPLGRENYINNTFNELMKMSYNSVANEQVKRNLDNLLKCSISSRRYFIFGSINSEALTNDITGILGGAMGVNNPEIKQQIQNINYNLEQIMTELNKVLPDTGISTGFSFIPCRHFGLLYDNINNLLSQTNQYRSIIYIFKELFSPSVYPIFIVGFFGIGGILRMLKLTRKIGSFLISFSIAISLLPIISVFFINLITEVDGTFNPKNITNSIVETITFLSDTRSLPVNCFDIKFYQFNSLYTSSVQQISDPNSNIITFSVYSMAVLLSLGLSLLAVISITVGINQLLGIDVSPFVLSYIARVS